MQGLEEQPHLKLKASQIYKCVVIVNDQNEAEMLAKMGDKYESLSQNREYHSFNCSYKGTNFTIVSCGTGSSGASVAIEELICLGVQTFVLASCAYSLCEEVKNGDIFINTAAVRDEGLTTLIVPSIYPAASHPFTSKCLKKSYEDLSIPYKTGICVSTALFYPTQGVVHKEEGVHTQHERQLKSYIQTGAQIIDMEASTLFILASTHMLKSASVHTIVASYSTDGIVTSTMATDEQIHKYTQRMFSGVLNAMKALYSQ